MFLAKNGGKAHFYGENVLSQKFESSMYFQVQHLSPCQLRNEMKRTLGSPHFCELIIFFLLKKAAAETKTKAETLADLSKQWDTEDEDMEETETPAVTAPEPTPETGAPEEPAAPVTAAAPEEHQETAMETEQVKF